jgi:hypothetical protein
MILFFNSDSLILAETEIAAALIDDYVRGGHKRHRSGRAGTSCVRGTHRQEGRRKTGRSAGRQVSGAGSRRQKKVCRVRGVAGTCGVGSNLGRVATARGCHSLAFSGLHSRGQLYEPESACAEHHRQLVKHPSCCLMWQEIVRALQVSSYQTPLASQLNGATPASMGY